MQIKIRPFLHIQLPGKKEMQQGNIYIKLCSHFNTAIFLLGLSWVSRIIKKNHRYAKRFHFPHSFVYNIAKLEIIGVG